MRPLGCRLVSLQRVMVLEGFRGLRVEDRVLGLGFIRVKVIGCRTRVSGLQGVMDIERVLGLGL